MKKNLRFVPLIALGALASFVMPTAVAIAAGEAVGESQRCISLSQIKDSPIIDDRTILVRMRAAGGYKRVDLMGSCPGLSFNGYARSSPENSFCTSDTLSVIGPIAMICKIDKIVTIDANEAKALEAKKK